MDYQTLTLLKLIIVAGLAFISFKKVKRIGELQQCHKLRHKEAMLIQKPINKVLQTKEQSNLSSSTVSKHTITNEQYRSVYRPFIHKDNDSDQSWMEYGDNIGEKSQSQQSFIEEIKLIEKMECEGGGMQAQKTLLKATPLKEQQKKRSFNFPSFSGKLKSKKKFIRRLSNTTSAKKRMRLFKKNSMKLSPPSYQPNLTPKRR